MSDASTVTRPSARVAQILDGGLRVAINRGSSSGIERGDEFVIVHQGSDIIDPETGESLGQLEIVRGRGRVFSVKEKYCLLVSLEQRRKSSAIGGLAALAFGETEQAPFERVQVGDLAKPV